jgi:hypothetical protein
MHTDTRAFKPKVAGSIPAQRIKSLYKKSRSNSGILNLQPETYFFGIPLRDSFTTGVFSFAPVISEGWAYSVLKYCSMAALNLAG